MAWTWLTMRRVAEGGGGRRLERIHFLVGITRVLTSYFRWLSPSAATVIKLRGEWR